MNDAPREGGAGRCGGGGVGGRGRKTESQTNLQLCMSLFYQLYILLTFFLCLFLLAGHLCTSEHHLNVNNMKYGPLTFTEALTKP